MFWGEIIARLGPKCEPKVGAKWGCGWGIVRGKGEEIPYVRLPGNPVAQREVLVSSRMSASTHSLGSAISRGWQSGHRENDRRQSLPASPTALSLQL